MRNLFLPDLPDKSGVSLSRLIGYTLLKRKGYFQDDVPPVGHPAAVYVNRKARRAGHAVWRTPASHPARHGICQHCGKRTYLSPAGYCRKDFLAGEGGLEVDFRHG